MPTPQLRIRLLPCLIAALLVMGCDQLSKYWLLYEVGLADPHQPSIRISAFFDLVMVWNHGVSFGMLSHPGSYVPWFLIAVALVIVAVVLWLAQRSTHRTEQLAYGAICGGALGNVIDRVRFGAVADFFSLHVGAYRWPAFNVADAAIFCGVVCLMLLPLVARWMARRQS